MKNSIIIGALLALAGCSNTSEQTLDTQLPTTSANFQTCPKDRPQICTKIYMPVCATRDTGIRCVTTPCPSTEQQTYGNSCTACADSKVIGYVPNACPAEKQQE